MKRFFAFLVLTAVGTGLCAADAGPTSPDYRQKYNLDPAKTSVYVPQMEKDLESVPAFWKSAPAFYYAVPALSDIPRLPDTYPGDGVACGQVRIIAAQGEYEPGSVLIAPRKNVDKFLLKATDLKAKDGSTIPAGEIDIKIIKNWYQAGSGWYGYFADALGRALTPELLLNDEHFVHVDPNTKDNYARCSNEDGSISYQWISADHTVTAYDSTNQAKAGLYKDADTLQPAVLNTNEFKQYFITVHAPKTAKSGIYKGKIAMIADGKKIGDIDIAVRVLPFALPNPKSNYNRNKGFYLCLYGTPAHIPDVLTNLVAHNAVTLMSFPNINPFQPEMLDQDIELAKKHGLLLNPCINSIRGSGVQVSEWATADDELAEVKAMEKEMRAVMDLAQKKLGHKNVYSYGVDEGGPWTIRRELQAWKAAHNAGAKLMVTTFAHHELLYNLDYMVLPGAPAPKRVAEVRKFHEMNPDNLCGWYANPHSGPENPDYMRRIHGFQAYKSDYDVSSNYIWYRNNWNDVSQPEHGLRGIIMVYLGRGHVFDTIEWEGVREGMDDVKYASYMKELALEAAASENGDVINLGRRALAYLAYLDEERVTLDAMRAECVNYIILLRKALNKGN